MFPLGTKIKKSIVSTTHFHVQMGKYLTKHKTMFPFFAGLLNNRKYQEHRLWLFKRSLN